MKEPEGHAREPGMRQRALPLDHDPIRPRLRGVAHQLLGRPGDEVSDHRIDRDAVARDAQHRAIRIEPLDANGGGQPISLMVPLADFAKAHHVTASTEVTAKTVKSLNAAGKAE